MVARATTSPTRWGAELRGGPIRPWTLLFTLVVFLGLVSPHAFAQATRLTIAAPPSASGNGRTPIVLTVAVESPPPKLTERDLQIEADGGVVHEMRAIGSDRFEVKFVPPRVAESTIVRVRASLKRGGVAAKPHNLRVEPVVSRQVMRTRGPLDMRVPKTLVLGRDRSATVSVRKVRGVVLTPVVSTGTLSALVPGKPGRLVATYRPPPEKFPQVAIIALLSESGGLVDWAPVALVGRPTVSAKGVRGAMVRVKVGDQEFGPFRTRANGRRDVRVLAPPGEKLARVIAVDPTGLRSDAVVALGAPPFRQMMAICPEKDEQLLVFAVNRKGAPHVGLRLEGSASAGRVGPLQAVRDGFYRTRIEVPDDAKEGDVITVEATAPGRGGESASCRAVVQGEHPIHIALQLDRDHYTAGGQPISVTLTPRYRGLRAPRAPRVAFDPSVGSVADVHLKAGEPSQARWNLPNRLPKDRLAVLKARIDAPGRPSAVATLKLRPGRLDKIELSAGKSTLRAETSVELRLQAVDAYGNAVSVSGLTARARGSVGEFSQRSPGVYSASYTAPAKGRADIVVVRDSDTGVQSSVRVAVVEAGWRPRVWLRAGYVSNFARVSSPTVLGGFGTLVPVLDGNGAVGVEVGYYATSSTEIDAAGVEEVTLSASAVPVLARVTYEVPVGPLLPYLGLTGGMMLSRATVSSATAGEQQRSSSSPAIGGLGGLGVTLGPGFGFLELGYLHARVNDEVVFGRIGGLNVTAGYAYEF